MIGVIMKLGSEIVEVRVQGNQVLFRTGQFGGAFTTLAGLKLSKAGVVKEFPDLEDKENWKEITIKRFKEKIKNINNEMDKIKYIVDDLSKFGYVPLYLNQQGHRIKKYDMAKQSV